MKLVRIKTCLSKVSLPNERLACVLQVLLRTNRNYILLFYSLFLVVALSTLFLLLFLRFLQSSKKREYDVAVILMSKWQSTCTHSFRVQKKNAVG